MMKKNVLALFGMLLIFGCSDTEVTPQAKKDPIRVENGRMVFQSEDLFQKTMSEINLLSNEEKKKWRLQFKFNSLNERLDAVTKSEGAFSQDEEAYLQFPDSYLMVLNHHAEIKIGDEIVWYNHGLKHAAKSEDELLSIKADPSKSLKKAPYIINPVEDNQPQTNGRIKLSHATQSYMPYQYEFNNCFNGKRRKYVHGLIVFGDPTFLHRDGPGYIYHTYLFLRMKMEYKASNGKWYESGDYRSVGYHISVDLESSDVRGNTSYLSWGFLGGYNDITATQDVQLFEDYKWMRTEDENGRTLGKPEIGWFYITITGYVNQAISSTQYSPGGSPCNEWRNEWNL